MDRDGFYADYGPSTVERNDPMFLLQKSCCWWSGQSWPFATTQTLKALANLLQNGGQELAADDYVKLLAIYARSHRKDGRPYLAEALHPDTGSFEGHDGYNHSEHYFHSGFCDLVITWSGWTGPAERCELGGKAAGTWFMGITLLLMTFPTAGIWLVSFGISQVSATKFGAGFHLIVDGKVVKSSPQLQPLAVADAVRISSGWMTLDANQNWS